MQELTIKNGEGTEVSVSGYTSPDYPGLAVHRDYTTGKKKKTGWTITHPRSGMALRRGIVNKRQAVAMASKAAGLADWYLPAPDVTKIFKGDLYKLWLKFCYEAECC